MLPRISAKATSAKRLYKTIGFTAMLVVTALFAWYVVRSLRGHDLAMYTTPHAVLGIVLAALCCAVGVPLLALAWRGMLSSLSTHKSWRELFGILGISQFGKYVPGHIAQYAGRVAISLTRGIPARVLATTMILETLLLIVAAVVMGMGTGMLSGLGLKVIQDHGSQLALIAVLVALAVVGLLGFRRFAPTLLKRFAPKYAPMLGDAPLPTQASLVRAFVWYCVVYLSHGIGLVLLAEILLPGVPHDYWLLVAAFSLAWVVGFVTPGAPAGLGIREGLLLLMLAPIYTTASASVLIIALRIATTLADALNLVAGALLLPRKKSASVVDSSPGA